jgi:signal transduction histidine kinase
VPDDLPLAPARGRLSMPPGEAAPSTEPAMATEPAVAAEPAMATEPAVAAEPAAPVAQPSTDPAAPATTPYASKSSTASWEVLYGVVFLAVLALVAFSGSLDVRTAIGVTSVAAMAPWYLLVGRSHLRAAEGTVTRRAVIYVTGIVVMFAVAVLEDPNAWFLCIALLPQCSEALPDRRALIPALIMTTAGAVSLGYWSHSSAGIATAVVLFVAITAFNVGFNGDLGRIITQSRERAELIEQLEATRAELAEVSRQAGVMAERQRLAGEIHDTLAQGFSSIVMLIQAAEAQLELSPATARRQLGLAAQTARENLAEARTLVGGLASAHLLAGTLEDALRRITERASAELGLQASFTTDGASRRLPAATEVVLLRTGQEALANVRKHAAAGSVAVRLCYASDRVRLEVTDDGAGFDPAVVNGGYGLRGMRARVDEAGGTIAVRSAPAEGTSVEVEVPA